MRYISLYTNISHELGEKALSYYISKYRDLIPERFSKEFIIESAMFVLKNNNFLFDRQMYDQVIGAAMGTIFAPPYACLSVGFLEETKLYPQLQQVSPKYFDILYILFKRYIDDGFILWPCEINIQLFENILNNLDPKIKFTLAEIHQVLLQIWPYTMYQFLRHLPYVELVRSYRNRYIL